MNIDINNPDRSGSIFLCIIDTKKKVEIKN